MHASLFRILDANLNRAREACRVMDDLCRFVLDDAALCESWKSIRHELVEIASVLDAGQLLAARNTEGDVGTGVTASGEYQREGAGAIGRAACGRLTEALRSLEEAAKAVGEGVAAAGFERLRYRVYTLEKSTLVRFAVPPAPQWRLCVLVTEALCRQPWVRVIEESIDGGADCIQLREKALDTRELFGRARIAREVTAERQCALIVNDRPDLAVACGADGVHLGQTDLPLPAVRRVFGDRLLVGISTGTPEEARSAVQQGADYVGLGPMFATTTKSKPVLAGPEYAKRFLADGDLARVPHLAIGGITPENVGTLRAFGVKGVAVSSAVCSADDPAAVCRAILADHG